MKSDSTIFGAALLAPALFFAFSAAGCYRTTGYDRAAVFAEEIPAVGGERVPGIKSMAGAGDYYIGNDFVALAVDASPPGDRSGIAGAMGGGSIVDVGYLSLDTSFRRAAMPCDTLDRMTPVINQDPDISLVFDDFLAANEPESARLEMRGKIYDPQQKLRGAARDSLGYVLDVSVTAKISLGRLDRFFTVETTIANLGSSAVGIRNIADFVAQRGGGFRILAAANEDYWGAPLPGWRVGSPAPPWGVDIAGSDFYNPLQSSARADFVALMGTEPGSNTVDCHISLGMMPLDSNQFLVACDPQDGLTETRPAFPERFVAGSLDSGVDLAPNASLSHRRRLYVLGGTSGAMEYEMLLETMLTPNQATGLLNVMLIDRLGLEGKKPSLLQFILDGSATRVGPVPSELRFERYVGFGDPGFDFDPLSWKLERLEWMEPVDSIEMVFGDSVSMVAAATPIDSFGVFLPPGTYRIVSRNREHCTVLHFGTNALNEDRPSLKTPIELAEGQVFMLREAISPERDAMFSPSGNRISLPQMYFGVTTRGSGSEPGFLQPLRFAVKGLGGKPDPDVRRMRSITSTFDANTKTPRNPGPPLLPGEVPPGAFHFVGGNSAFGVQMIPGQNSDLRLWTAPGEYEVFCARGPLSTLERFKIDSRPGMGLSSATVTVFQSRPPDGWAAFDVPGPSIATSGGMVPCEQLASALVEDVKVVACTELDHQVDAAALYEEFQASLNYKFEFKSAIGADPADTRIGDPLLVSARSSDLGLFGSATALFGVADANARNGGARPSKGWTLADFLTQAEGEFNVIHRPRGPNGIFTQMGFDPDLPLGEAAPWWRQGGLLSLGRLNGDFDALELLNAGSLAALGVDDWWREFKETRRDWFSLLSQQSPGAFTKALGFSSGKYSQDTPVGLVRTWLRVGDAKLSQRDTGPILEALRKGAAVVSSGPMLDAKVGGVGPGGLAVLDGEASFATLDIILTAPDWMPVDEIRVVVNGDVVARVANPKAVLVRDDKDSRFFAGTISVPLPAGKDAWLVVEAGAPLEASEALYHEQRAWNSLMKGIYPIAVANPIFLNLTAGGYNPPGL